MNEVVPIEHDESLHARSVLVAFGRGHDIGVTYNNIILSSEEPDIIDIYDRTISTLMNYAVLYWPGGNPGHGRQLEAIVQGEVLSAKHQADRVKERPPICRLHHK